MYVYTLLLSLSTFFHLSLSSAILPRGGGQISNSKNGKKTWGPGAGNGGLYAAGINTDDHTWDYGPDGGVKDQFRQPSNSVKDSTVCNPDEQVLMIGYGQINSQDVKNYFQVAWLGALQQIFFPGDFPMQGHPAGKDIILDKSYVGRHTVTTHRRGDGFKVLKDKTLKITLDPSGMTKNPGKDTQIEYNALQSYMKSYTVGGRVDGKWVKPDSCMRVEKEDPYGGGFPTGSYVVADPDSTFVGLKVILEYDG